jgi:glycosyltransferase involved in cell wall biosynthesis
VAVNGENDHSIAEFSTEPVDSVPLRVAVYICTFRRNEPLARLLDTLEVAAEHAADVAELGVIVVDDNPDGDAKAVVAESNRHFPLGLHYRYSGSGNIALARNIGVEAAMELADWVAMVDDDQIVVPQWLSELLRIQAETDADAVTAPVYARFDDRAPAWIHDQPFADLWCTPAKPDGAPVDDLQTANSMIRTEFLRRHPDVRFSTDLGQAGGEDMVFYRAAISRGLKAHYSHYAVSWELEPPERATFGYQLRRNLWHGNTEAITQLRARRDGRLRVMARAGKRGVVALLHPIRSVRSGRGPQLRYSLAYGLQSIGLLLGAAGIKLSHV